MDSWRAGASVTDPSSVPWLAPDHPGWPHRGDDPPHDVILPDEATARPRSSATAGSSPQRAGRQHPDVPLGTTRATVGGIGRGGRDRSTVDGDRPVGTALDVVTADTDDDPGHRPCTAAHAEGVTAACGIRPMSPSSDAWPGSGLSKASLTSRRRHRRGRSLRDPGTRARCPGSRIGAIASLATNQVSRTRRPDAHADARVPSRQRRRCDAT